MQRVQMQTAPLGHYINVLSICKTHSGVSVRARLIIHRHDQLGRTGDRRRLVRMSLSAGSDALAQGIASLFNSAVSWACAESCVLHSI